MKDFRLAAGSAVMGVARASFLLVAALATASHAQSALTRDQVKAELREAIRTGDLSAGGESNLKLNQLYPGRYPSAAKPGNSGAMPHAAMVDDGNSVAPNGELGVAGQEYSASTSTGDAGGAKTREQVKAETLEAIRAGEIVSGELGQQPNDGAPRHFARQRSSIHMAAPKDAASGRMMN